MLYEAADLRGDKDAVALDLPLANVRRLTLEVDFADQDVADRVVWAGACSKRGRIPK